MRLYGVAGFGMLSTCAQAFALELQAFSVLPSSKPPIWSKHCAPKTAAFEELIIPDEIHDLQTDETSCRLSKQSFLPQTEQTNRKVPAEVGEDPTRFVRHC